MTMTANTRWVDAVNDLTAQGEAYVLVTILGVRGSAPRDSGTKMVVTADRSYDTIGGGHLEYKAVEIAHRILAGGDTQQHIEHFPLGPSLGQCCGGSTSLLFEPFAASRINIMLFGAGHVGQALAPILSGLPCRLSWVDTREELFPANATNSSNVIKVASDTPADEVDTMPANSYYIVMTHNHQLDYEICRRVLKREDFGYLGLIGSDTKWKRFQQRFDHRGIAPELVQRINCPVGLSAVPGKRPMEVAVSIAGEIIGLYQRDEPAKPTQQGLHWKELKTLLAEEDTVTSA